MNFYAGDTFAKNIVFKNYELQPDDVIKVGMKKFIDDEDYTLPLITLTNLQTQFEYTPEQTKKVIADKYIMEIELDYANGKVATLQRFPVEVKEKIIRD